ncbi:alkaline phosphatase [Subtercola boreus]|uniref:Alkaline phosphatase n=1 Tax=Subtercola boreus TaxID=120213 RepID=A0A3E0VFV2_9MICO|nr:alkaline phosphatase [Subtercola boreus]RFA08423.1 alkaline phosphatase [Subtercola boreus]TQL54662.1 alkaline phosphatase [Subtercola boreus]
MKNHRRGTGARRVLVIAAATAVAGSAVLLPSAAFAAPDDFGGAVRNSGDKTEMLRDSIVDAPAKNVILLIGDGMGDSEITSARNYQYGAGGMLPGIDALPLTGQYTTYSLYKDGESKGKPDYVPDSAATGTAWATGTKTYDNAISVDIDGAPQQTLLEIAKANGLKTGNISTAELQDATPAVQSAHVAARSCYGPDSTTCGADALDQGGLGSISEQIIGTRPDLSLGGGSASFDQVAKAGEYEGDTLLAQAESRGYQLPTTGAELAAVTVADQNEPVLGLFAPGNFPTRYAPTVATVGGADLAPTACTPNPERLSTDLSLKSLTEKGINLLDTTGSKGFFLQVEGASIDKQDHAANACGQIGEVIDLDEAVQSALAFAEKDGNTLVIVTADHAHTSQIVDSTPPTSLSTALLTADGTTMKISYGTAAAGGSQQHTGTQLRIAAYGPGAANVTGLTDQTDNFFTMSNALQLDRDTKALSADAALTLTGSTVKPGASVVASATGFAGDRQVAGMLADDALGTADVIDGGSSFDLTAPAEEGTYTVSVEGAQSGKVVTATLTVAADAPIVTPTPTPSVSAPADPGAGAGGSGSGGSGTSAGGGIDLATTGAAVIPVLTLGAGLLAVGAVLMMRRRRHQHGA